MNATLCYHQALTQKYIDLLALSFCFGQGGESGMMGHIRHPWPPAVPRAPSWSFPESDCWNLYLVAYKPLTGFPDPCLVSPPHSPKFRQSTLHDQSKMFLSGIFLRAANQISLARTHTHTHTHAHTELCKFYSLKYTCTHLHAFALLSEKLLWQGARSPLLRVSLKLCVWLIPKSVNSEVLGKGLLLLKFLAEKLAED